jgi:hypothetical protein
MEPYILCMYEYEPGGFPPVSGGAYWIWTWNTASLCTFRSQVDTYLIYIIYLVIKILSVWLAGETPVDPPPLCRVKWNCGGHCSLLKCLIAGPRFNTYWIFDDYLIINFCQADLWGADPPPLCGVVLRMKLLMSPVKCRTCRIFYFILLLQPQAITGIGVNSDRAQHTGHTATTSLRSALSWSILLANYEVHNQLALP